MIFGSDPSGGQPLDRQQYAYQFYLNRGYSPVQAAGIVGGLRGETSNLNTTQQHDGGIGLGIAGWNGPRLRGLQNEANPTALDTQLSYVDRELKTSEPTAFAKLMAAQTPQQAGNAMLAYFRPSNWNVPGAHPERANYAASIFNNYSGDKAPAQPQQAAPAPQGSGLLGAPQQAAMQSAPAQSATDSPFNFAPTTQQQAPATDYAGLLGQQAAPAHLPQMVRKPLNLAGLLQLLQNAPPEVRGLLQG